VETEVQLAAAADGTIAIAWIAVVPGPPYAWIGYRFSRDGGATFSPVGHVSLPDGLLGSDPAMAVDAAGNFYVAAVGEHIVGMNPDYTKIFVAEAPKGTTTFGVPVEVTNPQQKLFNDHPKILVTSAGTIVVAFAEYGSVEALTSTGRAATSKDGQSWRLGTIAAPPDVLIVNLFWLCEGAGILYTTYLETTAVGSIDIALRSSTDDGATWTFTSTQVSLDSETPAALDPSCVASGNDAWVAYATNVSPTSDPNLLDSAQTIPIAHTGDRGNTIDPARVDALAAEGGALGLLPVLVREASGAFDVAYLSGRAEGDANGTMRYTRMVGAAVGPSISVDGPLVFTMNRSKANWLGDYLGAVVSGNRLLLAYPMNRVGRTHVYFRSTLLP
jgi:hypothetical protein